MFIYTTTGWMMWNFLAGALLSDVVPVLYDGHATHPGSGRALEAGRSDSGAAVFGASPAYIRLIRRAGYKPREHFALAGLETLTLAGSPVNAECMVWCAQNIKQDLAGGAGKRWH